MARLDPLDEPRLVRDRKVARRVGEHDRIHARQLGQGHLRGHFRVLIAIRAATNHVHHRVRPAGVAQRRDDVLGRGDRAMPEALGRGDQQDLLGSGFNGERGPKGQHGARDGKIHG